MGRQHRKDIAVSVIIGILVTFLPCWEWGGAFAQVLGCAVFAMFTWIALEEMEE